MAFVGVHSENGGASQTTTITVELPSGAELADTGRPPQAGDIAVLVERMVSGAATVTGPSGSTEVSNADGGNSRLGVWVKVLDSTDISNGSLVATRSVATVYAAVCAVWSDVAYDTAGSPGSSLTVSNTATIPAVTPGADDCIRLGAVVCRTNATGASTGFTAPAGWAELGDTSDTGAGRRGTAWLGEIDLTGQSGTPQSTAAVTADGAGMTYAAISLTLAPTGGGGDTRPDPDPQKLAVDGDSLEKQGGDGGSTDPGTDTGVGDIPARISELRAWTLGNIIAHGVTGRLIIGGGSTPTIETTVAAQRAADFEPTRRVCALGTNNQGASVADNMTDYRAYLALIGPDREVVFFGTGYYDQTECEPAFDGGQPDGSKWSVGGAASSPNAAMLNVIDEGTDPDTEPTILGYFDWNNYTGVRDLPVGVAPEDLWLMTDTSSPGGAPRHMVGAGYAIRNTALAIAAGVPPGMDTVDLTPAVLQLAGQPVTPTPKVTLTPAVLTLAGQAMTPTPKVTLTPAQLTLAGVQVTPTPKVTLTPATVTLAAQPLSPSAQPVAVALTPATLSLAGQPLAPAAQPVTVNLTPAVLTLSGQPLSLSGAGFVNLTPAVLSLSAPPIIPTPKVVLSTAVVSFAGQPLTPTPKVTLSPAVLGLAGQPLVAAGGPVLVTLTPATLQFAAVPLDLPSVGPPGIVHRPPGLIVIRPGGPIVIRP